MSESRRQPGPRTIPSLPRHHVLRRSEFEALERALFGSAGPAGDDAGDDASDTGKACGVYGPAGSGKTVLAAAVARSPLISRRFPDGVFWLTMGREPRLTVLQAQLARQIRKPRVFDDPYSGRQQLARLLVEQTVLLILDDVWHVDHASLLDVVGAQGRMLLTTRDRDVLRPLTTLQIELDTASPQQAQVLLARWAGCHPSDLPDEAARIAGLAGRLPLPLAMLGASAGVAKRPWNQVLAALETADTDGGSNARTAGRTRRATDVCLDALEPSLRDAYLELAVFPPGQSIPEEAIEVLWGIALPDMRDRLSALEKRALVVRDRQWDRVTVHDVQRQCAITRLPDLVELHGRLADTYAQRWRTRKDQDARRGGHIWQLGYHLVQAGRPEELRELLWNYDWLDGKLRADGMAELLADLHLAGEELAILRLALIMSSRVLVADPAQLPGQLIGRLGHTDAKDWPGARSAIRHLLGQARAQRGFSWLCPLAPTLTSPAAALSATGIPEAERATHTQRLRSLASPGGRAAVAMAVRLDGSRALISQADAQVSLWGLQPPTRLVRWRAHEPGFCALTLGPDGERAITASEHQLRVWQVDSGELVHSAATPVRGIRELAVSPDGGCVAMASADGALVVQSLADDAVLTRLDSHWPTVERMQESERLAESARRSSSGGRPALRTGEVQLSGPAAEGLAWRGVVAWVERDGDTLLVTAPADDTLRLWNPSLPGSIDSIEGGELLATAAPVEVINKVAVSPDRQWAVSTAADSSLRIWNLARRNLRTLSGHWDRVTALAITPDSARVVSASRDSTIRVWDLVRGAEVHTLEGEASQVTCLAIAPDGAMLAAGMTNGTLAIWDLWSGNAVARYNIEAPIVACHFTHGQRVLVGDVAGGVHALRLYESRNDRMGRLLARAIELDTGAREAFLEQQCGDDEGLRKDIEWLVAADHQFGDTQPVEPTEYLLEGSRIKHYEITRELGRGGMSRVFLAHDTQLDRPVAMKFLLTQTDELKTLFIKEAKMTARCVHENIVVIHDVGDHLGHPYLVLEYLQGHSLREWLANQDGHGPDVLSGASAAQPEPRGPGVAHPKVSPARALEIMHAVVRALVRAHAVGIVHRDLKPENIFITESNTVKVLDFGIAKAVSAHKVSAARVLADHDVDVSSGHLLVQDGRLIGTPAYMSPEQWNLSDVDNRTDIWAVGLILFELMLGNHPLAPLSAERVSRIAEVEQAMPQARDLLPEAGALGAVVDRCLMKNRDERYPSARDLLLALSARDLLSSNALQPVARRQLATSSGRISVKSGAVAHGLGTGWLVAPNMVVTAFRVVGDPAACTWRHENLDDARYALEIDAGPDGDPIEVALEPVVFDPAAELALLQCERPVPTLTVLDVAAKAPARGASWQSQAFPESHDRGVVLTGAVAELRGDDAASSLRLAIEDGTRLRWRGVPGAPILDAESNKVLGVITQLTDETSIGWGATVNAIRRLLQQHRDGASKNRLARSWRRCVDRMMRHLRNDSCIGVALLERSGFGAREVADDLLRRIRRSEERLLPIRLAPDRSSTSEARIYKKLLRGLRTGLERTPELEIPHDWWRQFWSSPSAGEPWEQFENAIDELLFGPLAEKQRRLLLLVDGLARLPSEQVVRWGYLMKGLCDEGLQLVVWGSMELHELTVAPQHANESSAFHHLERVHLPAFDLDDTEEMTEAYLGEGSEQAAACIFAVTGGHPALMRDAFNLPVEVLRRCDSEEISQRLLSSTHLERLRREVERDQRLSALLRDFAARGTDTMPREPLSQVEKRLWWLGILEEADSSGWRWFAPIMRRLGPEVT